MSRPSLLDRMEAMTLPELAREADRYNGPLFWFFLGFIASKVTNRELKSELLIAGLTWDRHLAQRRLLKPIENGE